MFRNPRNIDQYRHLPQSWNKAPNLPVTQPPADPIEVDDDYGDGTIDVTSCDAPRRRSLAFSILKMNLVGFASSVVWATLGLAILAQDPASLGGWIERQGLELGRDAVMTAVNFQGMAWIIVTFFAMLINVGVVFHMIHDMALHYQLRVWAVRLLARVVVSLHIIGAEKVKGWSSRIIDRSQFDRYIGFCMIIFLAVPMFLLFGVGPWFWVLSLLEFPAVSTMVTTLAVLLVMVPTTWELLHIAFHIKEAEGAE